MRPLTIFLLIFITFCTTIESNLYQIESIEGSDPITTRIAIDVEKNRNGNVSVSIQAFPKMTNYIKNYNLTKQKILQSFQEGIFIEFESKYGLSSKSRISKNIENIKIIYKFFGVAEIFIYFWHTFKKVCNIFWKAI